MAKSKAQSKQKFRVSLALLLALLSASSACAPSRNFPSNADSKNTSGTAARAFFHSHRTLLLHLFSDELEAARAGESSAAISIPPFDYFIEREKGWPYPVLKRAPASGGARELVVNP